jgi:hypothetical protein
MGPSLVANEDRLAKGIQKKIFGYNEEGVREWRKLQNVSLINCRLFLLLLGSIHG